MLERKWWTLIVVCVAIFMLLLDITIVNVALPNLARSLHASFTDLQWVVDAYALALATCVLNAGSLADLLGRKRVFVIGLALFTGASLLCGLATLSSGLFLLLYGLLRGNEKGWSSELIVGCLVGAAALLALFLLAQWREQRPMLDLRLFRTPTFAGAQIAAFAISSGVFALF